MSRRAGVIITVTALVFVGVACKPKPLPGASSCPMMPADNYWHARVDDLPVHATSDEWVAAIGADEEVHADFGSGQWDGGPIGIPYVVVPGSQPDVDITFEYWDESDDGPYPIPEDPPIEGGPDSDGDRHILVVDKDNCILSEVYAAYPQPDGSWEAGSGAVWDMTSNAMRPDGWTSADAAGLPVLPGLVRYDEVAAGKIMHAIRFTAPVTQDAYIWPARHEASDNTSPDVPPMGAWFRLKSTIDPEDFSEQARPIVVAMQTYGLILADNGSPWYISGAPNESWDNDALHELDVLTGTDFEAVDTSSLMVDPDSGQFQ